MTRHDFFVLFLAQLELAAQAADAQLGRIVPRHFGILRGSPGPDGRRVSVDDAFDELWLSDNRFYRIVDLIVAEITPSTTWIWANASGHEPSVFEATWNQPPGAGPFKATVLYKVRESLSEAV